MSTLAINTLTGQTSASSITVRGEGSANTNLQQGLAKAWINMNGTGTVAIRDSFNISGITDNGTGDHTQTFANDFSNNDYAPSGCTQDDETDTANGTGSMPSIYRNSTAMATGAMRLGTSVGSTRFDITGIFASVHGDLA